MAGHHIGSLDLGCGFSRVYRRVLENSMAASVLPYCHVDTYNSAGSFGGFHLYGYC